MTYCTTCFTYWLYNHTVLFKASLWLCYKNTFSHKVVVVILFALQGHSFSTQYIKTVSNSDFSEIYIFVNLTQSLCNWPGFCEQRESQSPLDSGDLSSRTSFPIQSPSSSERLKSVGKQPTKAPLPSFSQLCLNSNHLKLIRIKMPHGTRFNQQSYFAELTFLKFFFNFSAVKGLT